MGITVNELIAQLTRIRDHGLGEAQVIHAFGVESNGITARSLKAIFTSSDNKFVAMVSEMEVAKAAVEQGRASDMRESGGMFIDRVANA